MAGVGCREVWAAAWHALIEEEEDGCGVLIEERWRSAHGRHCYSDRRKKVLSPLLFLGVTEFQPKP